MKIAFIGQKGIPAISGGVEKHVEKLAVRLATRGDEVYVYVRSHYTHPALSEYKGVHLVHVPTIRTKHLDAISHTLFATVHALFQDYQIIHYHSIGPSVLSIVPRLMKPSARVIATFHTFDYFHKKWNWFARLCLRFGEWVTCRVPERTIAISENLADYAVRKYRRNIVMIPNGAEAEYEAAAELVHRFGLRKGRYVLSVSRLVEHKGIHYLIKAFQELERENKLPNNFKLAIVGAPAYTQDYENYLKVLAEGNPQIVFLGEQKGKDLAALFSHAAFFVQPSEEEGLSLALLEAMAYGILPIVSDIPANLEAVKNGAGVSFPVKDIEALKKTIAFYINRPDEAARIAAIARDRAESVYSWDAIALRTREVYEELLSPRGVEHYASTRK